jgi:hypothetical protein
LIIITRRGAKVNPFRKKSQNFLNTVNAISV